MIGKGLCDKMKNRIYYAAWHPAGNNCSFGAFILAEDDAEAEYLWYKHLKNNPQDHDTWIEAKKGCIGYATIKDVTNNKDMLNEFRKSYPRIRKHGTYKCETHYYSLETDHVRD